ncbi:hypothetical protein GS966_25655 [Rhodococcus hoagii]|nr:hypothetical protein [Prescottella equi]NKR30084.1 hypothetical protein [Prescottella equi]NKS61666.1 hypothetical protein [Prescottella equi]NKZ93229.1 hypothetical protein [Prescottella equi]NKZ93289.1 hypothetical protein [Prescottella equi]
MTESKLWTPTSRTRKWDRERDEFLAWEPGKPVSVRKRRRFYEWYGERAQALRTAAWEAEQERRRQRMANPSPDLIAAHRELSAAEEATGGKLMCARGADFSDPDTVRSLAALLRGIEDQPAEHERWLG